MQLPPSAAPLVEALLAGVREALADNFVGLYLTGSLALGGFDPATSDVDILVATEHPLSDAEFAAVRALHNRISPNGNQHDVPYDVTYIDRATLRRFAPGQRHVKVGHGEPLHRGDHRPNWVLERWTVREHGVTLAGPDPKMLIDPVSPDDLRAAVRDELRYRLRAWTDGTWPREEFRQRGTQAFEVATVCRALHTIHTGELCTKDQALDWGLTTLPERWHDLIEWARQTRGDPTKDEARFEEALASLRWAVSEAEGTPNPG